MSQCKALRQGDDKLQAWAGGCWKTAIKCTEFCMCHTPGYKTPLQKCQEENEKLRNVLLRIDTWAKAYPLKAFPKPDLKKAHEVLKAAGMTLDAISADNMSHVLDQIKEMVSEVLKEE